MDVVLAPLPATDAWIDHLHQRVGWAKEIHLLDAVAKPAAGSARVFIPQGVDGRAIRPDGELSLALGIPIRKEGWVKKPDLYQEAADWLLTPDSEQSSRFLLCEAGLARLGDPHLDSAQHIAFRDRPYYLLPLQGTDCVYLAKVMRWGRMWQRFLGVVVETSSEAPRFEFSSGLFLCDAMDGDSLIVAPIDDAVVNR